MVERMLEGKITLITGASSGIGRGSASVFMRHGARLALADVDEAGGEETARIVREASGEAIFIKADVSKASDVEAMVKRVVAHYGRLDCAFNNAGIEGQIGFTADCSEETWDQVMAVNLKGLWLCMKYEIPAMLAQGGGAIVNASSGAGIAGSPGLPAYATSKHGVIGLTRTAALEYATKKLRINALCPSATPTPMLERLLRTGVQTEEQLSSTKPMGRLGTVEEAAEAAAWLCSERATFVLGHVLVVDGGLSVR